MADDARAISGPTDEQLAWASSFCGVDAKAEPVGGGAPSGGAPALKDGPPPPATDKDLFFAKDSDKLTPSDMKALDLLVAGELADILTGQHGPGTIKIDGFASIEGLKPHNNDLALARAEAVKKHLTSKWGFSEDAFDAKGHGPTDKFSPTELNQNRRVTITPPPKVSPPSRAPGPLNIPPAGKQDGGPHSPTDLHMRPKTGHIGPDKPLSDDQKQEIIGDDMPRALVQKALKKFLDELKDVQHGKQVKVAPVVQRAGDALSDGFDQPQNDIRNLLHGNDKLYDTADLASQIAGKLPEKIPAKNFNNFLKIKPLGDPGPEPSINEKVKQKYQEKRDEILRKLPKSWQDPAKELWNAAVEKGGPKALEQGLKGLGVDSKYASDLADKLKEYLQELNKADEKKK